MLSDSSVDRFDQVFLEPLQSSALRFDDNIKYVLVTPPGHSVSSSHLLDWTAQMSR